MNMKFLFYGAEPRYMIYVVKRFADVAFSLFMEPSLDIESCRLESPIVLLMF